MIIVDSVSKSYDGTVVLKQFSRCFENGTVTAIVGTNGAGKTTLLDLLSGTQSPDTGTIIADGSDITYWSPHKRFNKRRIARTFQNSRVFSNMTVIENLLAVGVGGLFSQSKLFSQARALLEKWGLANESSSFARNLSGGQRKALGIARLLMTECQNIILDEPTASLSKNVLPLWASALENWLREEPRSWWLIMILNSFGRFLTQSSS